MRLPSRQSETRPYLLRKAAPRCYDFFPVVFFAGFFFPFVVITFFDTAFSVSTVFAAPFFLPVSSLPFWLLSFSQRFETRLS